MWVDGWQRHQYTGFAGKAVRQGTGRKVLIHTTEGPSVQSAMAAYSKYPPHLIVDLDSGQVVQHVALDRAAYALRGDHVEDSSVVQIEVVGYARDVRGWPAAKLDRLVDLVLWPIYQAWKFDLRAAAFKDEADHIGPPYLATIGSPIRMSLGEWDQFSGIVGHQHAPANTHWDPGALNAAYVVERLVSYVRDDRNTRVTQTKGGTVAVDQEARDVIEDMHGRLADLTAAFEVSERRVVRLAGLLQSSVSGYELAAGLWRVVVGRSPSPAELAESFDRIGRFGLLAEADRVDGLVSGQTAPVAVVPSTFGD